MTERKAARRRLGPLLATFKMWSQSSRVTEARLQEGGNEWHEEVEVTSLSDSTGLVVRMKRNKMFAQRGKEKACFQMVNLTK